MVNSKLKAFLVCTLLVAMVSLAVMFYYSVTFSNYTKIGVKYLEMIKTEYVAEKLWDRGARGEKFEDTNLPTTTASQQAQATTTSQENGVTIAASESSSTDASKEKSKTESVGKIEGENRTMSAGSEVTVHKESRNLTLCPSGRKQVGPLYVDKSVPKIEDVEKEMSSAFDGWVDKGGSWKPTDCQARVKMALIIPFRNRYQQLSIFVRQMHPMLMRQNLDYRIFVIEQAGDTPFNRAMLFNIGYKEAMKFDQYECLIFHDVDLIPEDDRNEYSCPSSPRHLSVAVDKFNYRLPYTTIFGGAGSFSREHFELINGFSNQFWGWGGEDDDLYQRIAAKNLHLYRPSMRLGRYTMIRLYHNSAQADPGRFEKLRNSAGRMATDGLNSLKYKVVKLTERYLYTLVTVDVAEAMENQR